MSERSLEQGEVMSSPESSSSSSHRSNHSEGLSIQPPQYRKHKHKHKKEYRESKHEHREKKEKPSLQSTLSRSSDSRHSEHGSRKERSLKERERLEAAERERLRKEKDKKGRYRSRDKEKRDHDRYSEDSSYGKRTRSRTPKIKKHRQEDDIMEQKDTQERVHMEEFDDDDEMEDELEKAFKDAEKKTRQKLEQESEISDDGRPRIRRVSKSGRIKSKFEDSSSSSTTTPSSDSSSSPESNKEIEKPKKSERRDTSSGGEDESPIEDDGFYRKDKEEEEEVVGTPPQSPVELKAELPPYLPALQGCRNVEEFHCLNRIEEGTYGVVYRARDLKTDEIVALKRLKMEREKEGFPITSLREINTLLKAQHPNIVTVREIVVGSNMDKIFIVMDYVEHDLKSLMESMKEPFIQGEVKTLMIQLLRGVNHLHDNWIMHRDLKTSNLLLSHQGVLKIGDFGLAREFGSPLKAYTPIVVTLWYRAPELLLQDKLYTTSIDLWSVGCIFGELLTRKALFPGKSEIDQLNRIFKDLGTPNEKIWEGVSQLPVMKKCTFKTHIYNELKKKFGTVLTECGFDLMNRLLTYNPQKRITASDALNHPYFRESPLPVKASMFPTWPAKSEKGSAKRTSHGNSPKAPSGGKAYAKLVGEDEKLEKGFFVGPNEAKGAGFSLKF